MVQQADARYKYEGKVRIPITVHQNIETLINKGQIENFNAFMTEAAIEKLERDHKIKIKTEN